LVSLTIVSYYLEYRHLAATERSKTMREPWPPRPDLDDVVEQIIVALGRPLRRTDEGARATIAERVLLARKEIVMLVPDAAAAASHAEGLDQATAAFSDAMPIPVTGVVMSMAQFREALEMMKRLHGPSPKQDTAKQILAEMAAGLVQELSTRPLRVYREVAGLFHKAVLGHFEPLRTQCDAIIRDRKKYNNWKL
jgi:hypothetical protein